MSLEATSQFSPSTSFQSLCVWLACSCSYHSFSLCQLTTLTIHPSLSFNPGSKPTSFTNLSHHRLSSGLRTDSTDFIIDRFFWAPRFLFLVFFSFLFFHLVPCRKSTWLFVSFWVHVNIVHRIISYRISQSYSLSRLTDWRGEKGKGMQGTPVWYVCLNFS